jgi:hypothetical protein
VDGWNYQIVEIAEAFAHAQPGEDGACLLALHGALDIAPRAVAAVLGPMCEPVRAQNLADAYHHELAFTLVERVGMMLSRGPGGQAQATVVAPGLFGETTSAAASVPLAIGGALVAGLLQWAAASRASTPGRVPH